MKRKNKVSIDALNYLKFAGDHHFATWFWYNSMGRMITKLPHASYETTTQKLLHTSYEAATLCALITVNSSKAQPITDQHA